MTPSQKAIAKDFLDKQTREELAEEAQALRRAHCSRKDRSHECVGTCFIDRGGIRLSCQLCGTDNQEHEVLEPVAEARAKAVVEAAGMKWENLCEAAREMAIRTVAYPWFPQ